LPPIVLRYLPQWVLAGSALVAFAVVGTVYLNNPPVPMVAAEKPARLAAPLREATVAPAPAVESVVTAAVTAELPPAPITPPQTPARIAAPKPVAVAALAPVQTPPPAVAPVRVAARALLNETSAPPAQPTGQRPPVAPAAAEQAADEGPANRVARIAPALTRELPAIPSAPPEPRVAVAAARPAEPDPNATLAQFMASFERGDTQAFMALFDEVAIGSVGGKPQIRRQHDSLFRSTDLRHLDIEGMAWSQEGNWFRGEGRYRKTLMPKGELRLQTETGVFRIQLLRRGEQALIMGFDYLPGERS